MLPYSDIEDFFNKHSIEFSLLTKKECWRIQQKWREAFSRSLKDKEGVWQLHGIDWHTFSFKYAAHKSGAKAQELYNNVSSEEYYIIFEEVDTLLYKCQSKILPAFSDFGQDIYVFPDSLEWTMDFTHEHSIGLGPYFSLKEWQEK
jgi:hypothetical protein